MTSRLVRLLLIAAVAAAVSCGGPERGGRGALEGEAARLLEGDTEASLALFYGSELLGSIDGCGCMGSPRLGGLPYRASYTEGFRSAYPDVPFLQLDAGRSIGDFTNAAGEEVPDLVAANEWVLDALDRLGFDAVNLTAHDAPFLAGLVARTGRPHPLADRLVSANLEPAREGVPAPHPYVVRTLEGERLPGGRLRVAVAGVTEPAPKAGGPGAYRVVEAAPALERVLPGARREADLVVVLAYVSERAAAALAPRLEGLADVLVVANSLGQPPEPKLGGPVRVVYSWYKTQQLGELRIRLDGSSIARAAQRYVVMDEPLPRDPEAEAIVAAAKDDVRKLREARFGAEAR